jgi:hypothetical protein
VLTVEEWLAGPARWRDGPADWTGHRAVTAPLDAVVAKAVRPGPPLLGAGLAVHGGPERFYATSRSGWRGVEVDVAGRRFAVEGRLGWRIETSFDPYEAGTLITRRIYGLSPGKRRIVGLYQAVSLTRLVRTLS